MNVATMKMVITAGIFLLRCSLADHLGPNYLSRVGNFGKFRRFPSSNQQQHNNNQQQQQHHINRPVKNLEKLHNFKLKHKKAKLMNYRRSLQAKRKHENRRRGLNPVAALLNKEISIRERKPPGLDDLPSTTSTTTTYQTQEITDSKIE